MGRQSSELDLVAEGLDEVVGDLDATVRLEHATRGMPRAGLALESGSLPRLDVSARENAELRVVDELGRGGMGQVQLAHQRSLDRDVALKRLLPDHAGLLAVQALVHEGVTTGRLEHPNIVPVHMLGEDADGRPVMVMKRVEGVPWKHLIADPDHPAWARAKAWSGDRLVRQLEIFIDVCSAIDYGHVRGIVHRDIKPDNVMIGSFGEVYVLDWGIACAPGTDAHAHLEPDELALPLGTPRYMAPEMLLEDGVIDERTDVFLLGATLHHALTGRPRHAGSKTIDVLRAAFHVEPCAYPPQIPRELAVICNKATEREPARRYVDAASLRQAVIDYIRHRASIELTHAAEQRLASLQRHLDGQEVALVEAHKLFNECRFAFSHALRDYPESAEAKGGLQRCLELMAKFELRRGNLDAARGLLAELPSPRVDLAAEVAEREAEHDAEVKQVASLKRFEHEHDVRVAWRTRVIVFIVTALLAAAGVLLASDFGRTPLRAIGYWELNVVLAVVGLGFTVAVFAARRALLANAVNRRLIALFYLAVLGEVANREAARRLGLPIRVALLNDLILLAALASTSVVIDRRFLSMPLTFVIAAVLVALMPGYEVPIFAIGMFVAFTSVAAVWTVLRPKLGDHP